MNIIKNKESETSKRIYLTHCSAKKSNHLRLSGEKTTPEKLYTALPTQRFINRCKEKNVDWAIFSDKYGIWFPFEEHTWYDKNPSTVNGREFEGLVNNFNYKLGNYNAIYFYRNPGRFHRLYRKLLNNIEAKDKIVLISHLREIQ